MEIQVSIIYKLNEKTKKTNTVMPGIETPDETGVVDLSVVADNPTYVMVTSSRVILAENLKFLLLNIHIRHFT